MPRCLTSARLSMTCTILKPASWNPDANVDSGGQWVWEQDPDSGAIVKRWYDDPLTDDVDESRVPHKTENVSMMARGIMSTGVAGVGSTEKFSEIYTNVDWVRATFPKNVNITKRDRVTDIRTKRTGELVWKEEEMNGAPATIFDVMGVTPILDPFNNLIEYSVLMHRSEVQDD